MKKYLIEPFSHGGKRETRCSARGDAGVILERIGYEKYYIPSARTVFERILNYIVLAAKAFVLYAKLRKDDIVLIQWPTKFGYCKGLYRWVISQRRCNLQVLVHDIDFLRGASESNFEKSLKMFRLADLIILHSAAMRDFVTQQGITAEKIKILECFDYLTTDEITARRTKTKNVVFVGQLDRCLFLDKISEAHLGIHINLYGRYEKDLGAAITHKGSFRADNVSIFQGSWGLVWGGDTIDECTGNMGDYIRYNSPHKLSLFIVSHLPIIIWDKAAKAAYVREKGIGICVSSLRDISRAIDSVTEEEYELMMRNIERESAKLRGGEQLLSCLASSARASWRANI